MPDIAMCVNSTCDSAKECYRFMAVPDEHWQPYELFGHVECTAFMPIEGRPVRTMQEIERRGTDE